MIPLHHLHRIHRFFADRCRSIVWRKAYACGCVRHGFLCRTMLTFVYSPIEFWLRRRIQAKHAALKRRKIPFFNMPLL